MATFSPRPLSLYLSTFKSETTMSKVTIYHNPRCSKSRQTLELLIENGFEPNIVLYLENTPDADVLASLIQKLGMTARELLRTGENEYKDHGLDNPDLSDEEIIQAMLSAPILIQRPIVECGEQARIGRPPEQVLEILA
jgi:arsenate reductase (glutaredoxin)